MPQTDLPVPDLTKLRSEYRQRSLCERDVDRDPVVQFIRWLDEAIQAGAHEPNAMTLATSTPDGAPSARMVLLKDIDQRGFAFYTNYQSRKGQEIEANPRAALVFYWPELEREVRVEGDVSRTSDAESDAYFASRPLESRIGAAASPQSQPIPNREFLERLAAQFREQYRNGDIPRPPHWGGYRLRPTRIEFWQGRESRLHDRIEYASNPNGQWIVQRLAP